jgi:hypothetical protein
LINLIDSNSQQYLSYSVIHEEYAEIRVCEKTVRLLTLFFCEFLYRGRRIKPEDCLIIEDWSTASFCAKSVSFAAMED